MSVRIARWLAVVLFAGVIVCAAPGAAFASLRADGGLAAPRRSSVIVAVADARQMAAVRAALERNGGLIRQQLRWNAFVVAAPLGMDSTQFSAKVKGIGGVRYADGNATRHAMGTANDPLFPQQWGLPDIGATTAWDTSEGSGTPVAVIDTGIDSTHPDLVGNVVLFKNYVTPSTPPEDDNLHGTHVAGIIAELRNNGLDGAGTAPKAKVWAFKVLDASGSGSDADVASAIRDAVDLTPCRILSMSLGGTDTSQALSDAVAYARSKGAVVIAAAGNSNSSIPSYPAAYPGVVGVGAVDSNNVRASFSNFGSANCDIVAPGVNILSTVLAGGMAMESGTSMATPFVSGSAALLWSRFPSLDATGVINLLQNSAQDLGTAGVDQFYGHGLVRPDLALAAASPDTTAPTTFSDAVTSYINSATIHLTATDLGGSGVAHTYYRLDAGPQIEGTTIAVSTYGAHSLEFWSVDSAGNVETPHHTVTFSIDDTLAPATTSDAVAVYTSSATIHLTAADNTGGSGVAHTWYRLDGGLQTEGASVSTSVTGPHTLEFWSADNAGNTETPHKSVGFTVNSPSVTYTIAASAGPGGSIAPTGVQTVGSGTDPATFTITPNTGFHIADVLVDGSSLGAVGAYRFTNVSADHTIAASFAADVVTPIPTSITIATSTRSTTIGRTATLSGAVTPISTIGVNIVVYVMKPGKSYWSYSSNRTVYSLGGAPAWLYKYTFKAGMARGTYRFKARCPAPGFASSDGFAVSESATLLVSVR